MANGSKWERDVCKILSKWINGSEKPYVYWRSAGSGSVFTSTNGEAGKEFAGDIYAIREEGKPLVSFVSIECKSGYDSASLDKFLKYNKSDHLRDFWKQCVEDAQISNKFPMLIFKKKGYPTPWVGISNKLYEELKNCLTNIRFIHLHWNENLPDSYFFEMKEFFEYVKPETINELSQKFIKMEE